MAFTPLRWLAGAALGTVLTMGPAAADELDPVTTSQLDLRFTRMDKDHDALLGRGEIRSYPLLTSQFTALDRDGDGALSRDEFTAVVLHSARLGEVLSF